MLTDKSIRKVRKFTFDSISAPFLGKKYQGKVRDFYKLDDKRILITTDRISAFDRILGYIPYKGQVLNTLAAFWFEKTRDIIPNHIINIPHPNIAIVKNAKPYPVEMVVRGFISGVTSTSIWRAYELGERTIYGIKFHEGLRKNQELETPIITPTTKAEHGAHDERLTREEILKRKIIPEKVYLMMEKAALALYKRGNEICKKRGLILVDTKYEFAQYKGKLILIDEMHTPDSSRFWIKKDYLQRFKKGLEPENFDKEFFRLWYTKKGYRGDGEAPLMSIELQIKTALRYIKIYEMITGKRLNAQVYPLEEKILKVLKKLIK